MFCEFPVRSLKKKTMEEMKNKNAFGEEGRERERRKQRRREKKEKKQWSRSSQFSD
jgi:hypothetical protein